MKQPIASASSFSSTIQVRAAKCLQGLLLVSFALLWSVAGKALELNSALPPLDLTEGGEIVLVDKKKAVYKPWSSESVQGKLTFLQVLAASNEAAELNDPFLKAIEDKQYPTSELHSVNIVVSKKIPGMFRGFVKSNLKKNKQMHPQATIVDDRAGLSWESWTSESALATIILLDTNSEILFYRQGKLSDTDAEEFIKLVDSRISQ